MYRKTGPVCDQDDGAHCPNITGADNLPDTFPCALTGLQYEGAAMCQPVRCHGSMKLGGVTAINDICGSPFVGNESMRIWRRATYS